VQMLEREKPGTSPENSQIAFDTNIWVSFTIGKRLDFLKVILTKHNFQVFICPEIVNEYLRVVRDDRIKKYISNQRISDTLNLIETFTHTRPVKSTTKLSRDPNDDFLLAFCHENNLDYLITGDKDLLVLKKYHSTQIVTFTEFTDIIS
jgi:putative PIN family toxin of toxin-antitoxin system